MYVCMYVCLSIYLSIYSVIKVQILDEAVCMLHSAKEIGKSMDPTILPTDIGK